MSLRVSDLQVLMLRSQEVGKAQQVHQVSQSIQQQQFADGLIRQSEMARQAVQTLPQTEQAKINGDQQREKREDAPRKHNDKKQPDGDKTEELTSPFSGNIIDCKI